MTRGWRIRGALAVAAIVNLAVVGVTPAEKQDDGISEAKRDLIVELVQKTQVRQITEQLMQTFSQQMVAAMRRSQDNLPPEAIDLIEEETQAVIRDAFEGSNGLLEAMYPIYAEHFTQDELRQLIAFYEGDLGQKLIDVMPELSQEGMRVGRQWGRNVLAPRIQRRVRARLDEAGYDLE